MDGFLQACDSNGTSLLHAAARAGSYQVVKDFVLSGSQMPIAFECHPISRTWSFVRLMLMPSIVRALASWAHVRGDGLPELSSKRCSRMFLLEGPHVDSGSWRFVITERCTFLETLVLLNILG